MCATFPSLQGSVALLGFPFLRIWLWPILRSLPTAHLTGWVWQALALLVHLLLRGKRMTHTAKFHINNKQLPSNTHPSTNIIIMTLSLTRLSDTRSARPCLSAGSEEAFCLLVESCCVWPVVDWCLRNREFLTPVTVISLRDCSLRNISNITQV